METIVVLAVVTFALGLLLGFVGAGGAGLVVALLTTGFHLPVHQAIGTGLAAMCFVSVSGAISHFREGNVAPRAGLIVGVSGVFGAFLGAQIGVEMPERPLKIAAGVGLWILALLVWLRTRYLETLATSVGSTEGDIPEQRILPSVAVGVTGGALSAFLGVGMTPFLQLGLLVFAKLPLRLTVGTTMVVLIFTSISGALSLAAHGQVSAPHLIGTVVGLSLGSFIGARFTKRAPRQLLRSAVVVTPALAGAILLFG